MVFLGTVNQIHVSSSSRLKEGVGELVDNGRHSAGDGMISVGDRNKFDGRDDFSRGGLTREDERELLAKSGGIRRQN